jgi:hypothetical protein
MFLGLSIYNSSSTGDAPKIGGISDGRNIEPDNESIFELIKQPEHIRPAENACISVFHVINPAIDRQLGYEYNIH